MLILFVCIYLIVGLLASIVNLVTDFRNSLTRRSLLRFLLFMIGVPALFLFNFLWGNGFSMYVNKKMADKYSYINRSEKYIDEGAYKEALDYAEKTYQKEFSKDGASPFFLLTYLYEHTRYGLNKDLTAKYGAIINYAYCLRFNDNATKAESLYNTALEISESAPLKEKVNYKVFPTLSLAELYLDQGKYGDAELYFEKLLGQTNQLESEDVEYVCLAQDIFAAYAEKVGDFNKATRLQIKNLELYEKSDLSKKSSIYLTRLILAAYCHIRLGDMNSAGELVAKAQKIAENKKKKEIYLVFLGLKATYCNIAAATDHGLEKVLEKGWWYKVRHFFSKEKPLKERFTIEAESCLKEMTDKYEDLGNELAYSRSLSALASFYLRQSNYGEAQKQFTKSLQVFEPHKGEYQESYYNILLWSLITDLFNNNKDKVAASLSQVENYYLQNLTANFLLLTEEEKESFISKIERRMSYINAAYININSPETRIKLYDNVLATKNIALYSNQHIRQIVSFSEDSIRMSYYNLLKQKEAYEVLKSYSSINQDRLENEIRLREKNMVRCISKLPSYRPFNPRSVKWTDVRNSLQDEEAAVEFINVSDGTFSQGKSNYFALLLTKHSTSPELIPLFREEDLMKVLNKGGAVKERTDSIYLNEITRMQDMIWTPLETHLGSTKKVFISLSGLLHRISFPALLADKSYDYELVGSTRQITMARNESLRRKSIALYGDIDYDSDQNRKNGIKDHGPNSGQTILSGERGKFERLKYSMEEIEAIQNLFKTSGSSIAELFTDTLATKSSFMNLKGKNFSMIHLATHGFYFNSNSVADAGGMFSDFGQANTLVDNPLSRCGLLFAGANNTSRGSGKNDGVLTALEISRLDLSNVDLVVLSACETGLGDIQGSEGVKGFHRAFTMAGAGNTLISLWKVSDEHTSELMTLFYKHLLNGQSNTRSLKMAQLEMKKRYASPFYWAGFVLVEG